MAFTRTPVAWLLLVDRPGQLTLAVVRMAFAVLLMFGQLIFMTSVLDTQCRVLEALDADVFIVSNRQYSFSNSETFPRRRLYQAQEVAGVASAVPLYVELGRGLLRPVSPPGSEGQAVAGVDRSIRVFAFDPAHRIFLDPRIDRLRQELQNEDAALFDTASRPIYGSVEVGGRTLLCGRRLEIVGTFQLGPDFVYHGNLILSDANFLRYFPELSLESPSLGLLRVSPGADPKQVARAVGSALPGDVDVLTRSELLAQEARYFLRRTPTGIVFGFGLLVGFAVGVITCNQILFTDVMENLPRFAMLKAIGYSNGFLFRVVAQEACWLCLLGFIPGLLISLLASFWLEASTGVLMRLTVGRVALIGVLSLMMCLLSALVAVRKAMKADPAEVF